MNFAKNRTSLCADGHSFSIIEEIRAAIDIEFSSLMQVVSIGIEQGILDPFYLFYEELKFI